MATRKLIKYEALAATLQAAAAAAGDALSSAGISPDYISLQPGVLPNSQGAGSGTYGAYFTIDGLWQRVQWSGSAWSPVGTPLLTYDAPLKDAGGREYHAGNPAFGITGDGVTDDSPALQSLCDRIAAAGGGTLYVPRGTYYLGSTVDVGSGTHIVGAGDDALFLLKDGGTGLRASAVRDVHFSNFALDINTELSNYPIAIYIVNSTYCSVRQCHIYNSKVATAQNDWTVHAVLVANCDKVWVQNNWTEGCQLKVGKGRVVDIHVDHNICENAQNVAISFVSLDNDTEVSNCSIDHNIVKGIRGAAGIYVGADTQHADRVVNSNNVSVSGNVIEGDYYYAGIQGVAGSTNHNWTINNNIVHRPGGPGNDTFGIILFARQPGLEIDGLNLTGNQVHTCHRDGINIQLAVRRGVVSNNTVTGSRGMSVSEAFRGIIGGNIIEGGDLALSSLNADLGPVIVQGNQIDSNRTSGILLDAGSGRTITALVQNNQIMDTQAVKTMSWAIRKQGLGTVNAQFLMNVALSYAGDNPYSGLGNDALFNFAYGALTNSRNNVTRFKSTLSGRRTIDPGPIAAGAIVTHDVTVTGAQPGDNVLVGHTTVDGHTNLRMWAKVLAADLVRVYIHNTHTTSSFTPGSGTTQLTVLAHT